MKEAIAAKKKVLVLSAPEEEEEPEVINLMDALQRSLEAKGKKRAEPAILETARQNRQNEKRRFGAGWLKVRRSAEDRFPQRNTFRWVAALYAIGRMAA